MNLKAVTEGLLFVSGEEGIDIDSIADILSVKQDEAIKLIDELKEDYQKEDRGIELKKYGDKYKLVTKKQHAEYYKRLVDEQISEKLSPSALEVLAIIAYNEPVTRITIDEIRGVSSAHLVRKLVFKNLIEEKGRSDLPGKPRLYGVTHQFLDYFGIESVKDLPKIDLEEKNKSIELYDSKYTDQ
ncbi:MAG: SMC-Scp complex subunit ScpB [Bacilli bacterium]|nr:SMC-Scp complex subunit ScpB [Bacilli bacterium]